MLRPNWALDHGGVAVEMDDEAWTQAGSHTEGSAGSPSTSRGFLVRVHQSRVVAASHRVSSLTEAESASHAWRQRAVDAAIVRACKKVGVNKPLSFPRLVASVLVRASHGGVELCVVLHVLGGID